VGPRAGLDRCGKSRSYRGSISGPANTYPVAIPTELPGPTEMNTRNNPSGYKGGECIVLTKLPHSCADCLEIWEPQPPGILWASPGLKWDCFTFTFNYLSISLSIIFYIFLISALPICNHLSCHIPSRFYF
jgi:hypothetical protein